MNNIVDDIYNICLRHKNLLDKEHEKAMKAIISTTISSKLKEKSKINKEKIRKVFFGDLDFSRFSDVDTDSLIRNIQSTITIWEENS